MRSRVCPYFLGLGRKRARARARTRSGVVAVTEKLAGPPGYDLSQPRWSGFSFRSGSGRESKRCCDRNAEQADPLTMIASFSRRCCGGAEQACLGAIFHRISARGRPCSTASTDGRSQASGNAYSWRYRRTAMTSGIASTARSTGHISMRLVEKGGSGTGHRSVAWGAVDQGPPRGGRPRFAAHF